ncbi:CvpA family protein [Parasphingopyxis algicola]|uniref:CvpA family protein n=1 Tax=Parasphingopyxis algicola TaxID=2026624 RepID=UPI0015A11AB2|nr:CvpA family protein [Parasphingopyxis algicola]QLC23770.1 CvpA family protein [Parasphingopyxis algicola]
MTALDAIVLILVGGGAIHGFMRGFTFEVMTLLSWLIGVIALRLFHGDMTGLLAGSVGSGGAAPILAFAIVFGGAFFATRFIGRKFGIGVRESIIGPFDRILGLGFGAVKGLIVVTLLFLLANLATDIAYGGHAERPAWMRESRTFPLLNASGRAIIDFVEMRRHTDADEPTAAD